MADKIVAKFKLKDGREVALRYPVISDIKAMADYINTLSKEKTFISFQGEQITYEFEEERLTKLLKQIDEKKAIQLLAFCESQLVAISDIIMRERAERHVATFGISVAKDLRGAGLGQKLMQIIIDEALKKIPQLKILLLGCFSDNTAAQNLYRKIGFKKIGSLPGGLMHQDHFDNHIYMYKQVRDL